ncbi:MAG: right-handed parallel beta-helix repeat-containing protein [Candidatus Hodarchaeales archaeon]
MQNKRIMGIILIFVLVAIGSQNIGSPLEKAKAIVIPDEGDWVITNNTEIIDEKIMVNANVVVEDGGSLRLTDCDIQFNCTYPGEFKFEVREGGQAIIEGCTIDVINTSNAWNLMAYSGSNFSLTNSNINNAGHMTGPKREHTGVWVNNRGAKIVGNTFDSCKYGTSIYQTKDVIVANNTYKNMVDYGVFVGESTNITVVGNDVEKTNDGRKSLVLMNSDELSIISNTIKDSGESAIWVSEINNSKILENNITSAKNAAIEIYESNGLEISRNTMSQADRGIELYVVRNMTIHGNYITKVREESMYGGNIQNARIANNTITRSIEFAKDMVFINGANNLSFIDNKLKDSGGDGIVCQDLVNSTLKGNLLDNITGMGLIICSCNDSSILDNWFDKADHGITGTRNSNLTIKGNTITNFHSEGVDIMYSDNIDILANKIVDTPWGSGITIREIDNCSIMHNEIEAARAIIVSKSDSTKIFANTANYSKSVAIDLDNLTVNCMIWGNNLGGSAESYARDTSGSNSWDNGTMGNYYDDYEGIDLNNDGIGDTAYEIDGGKGVVDRYPLMRPFYGTIQIEEEITTTIVKDTTDTTYQNTTLHNSEPISLENITSSNINGLILIGSIGILIIVRKKSKKEKVLLHP